MPLSILKYAGPFVLALVLHVILFFFVDRNWSQSVQPSSIVDFKAINAELVVLKPKLEVKRQSTAARPEIKINPVDSQPELASDSLSEIDGPEKTDISKDRELARQELLDKLYRSNLEANIEQEASELESATNQQVAALFQAKIYDQVRRNWRRPPSARNEMQTKLLVELIPTGEIISVTVVESSGLEAFDRSAEQAVIRSSRFEVPDNSRLFEAYFRNFYFLFRPQDLLR